MNIAMMIPKALTVVLVSTATVRQGLEIMRNHSYTAVPVTNEEGVYIGCVTEGDFLQHLFCVGTTDLGSHERHKLGSILREGFCPALSITAAEEGVCDSKRRKSETDKTKAI